MSWWTRKEDAAMCNVVPTPEASILNRSFTTGTTTGSLYQEMLKPYVATPEASVSIKPIDNGFVVESARGCHYCKDMDDVRGHIAGVIGELLK